MGKETAEIGQGIVSATAHLARRINMHASWRSASVSMLWGTGIALAFILIGRLVTIPIPEVFAVATILGGSLAIGIIRGLLARISALEAAMIADARLDLKERLSSAVELLGEKNRSAMAELQLEDAADHARSLDPKAIRPRIFPITARILPLALLCLIFFMYALSYYDRASIPAEIRQAIKQAGTEIEMSAQEMDENSLSREIVKLSEEMEITGRELQDESLTKKEALKNLSNLARKMETLKLTAEIAEELRSEMTPEKRRLLNELLKKLADNLRDQAFGKILSKKMEELSQEILKAQQAELSADALKELSAALEQMKVGASDIKALQQMSKQVTESKRDIGQMNLMLARGGNSAGTQEEEVQGRMGSGPPGKKPAGDSERNSADASRLIPTDAGYDSELDGQLSDAGRSVSTEIEADTEKGTSIVPYQEIYVKYRDAADDAIIRPAIPWTYKEHIKSYFDAIKPKEE